MSNILVAYFSASGVTAKVAKTIAESIKGDLHEIQPNEVYTSQDLDWMDTKSRSSLEMKEESCRPAIVGSVPNMDQYDTIFLGFPVWWYVEPRIIDTFLDQYDFSNKTIIPFATSGSSGIENCETHLHSVCPSAVWKKGKLLNHADPAAWAQDVLN